MTLKWTSRSGKSASEDLRSFVEASPSTLYTFDSERDAPESEICRHALQSGKPVSKECIKLQMESKKMFESMQELGFFCALPMDPGQTHMECRRLPTG